MKLNKIAILSLFIVLICFIGAASAAEDVNDNITMESSSVDELDSGVDETLSVDDAQETESSSDEETVISCSGTSVNAQDWSTLRSFSQSSTNFAITLNGTSYTIDDAITFANNACIIGTSSSYITGGSTSKTPFVNTNSDLTLHFVNVKFQNVYAKNLLELDGTVYLINCTFDNVQTATGHNSVIYNTNNLMYLSGCNITNCNTGYGAVTNYNSASTTSVIMYVDDCKFENNSATVEPGAINNCGILYVNNSEFNGNHANWWAGAIHTHMSAQTEIENSIFRRNTAGWNGGALFTYSKLKIYNCTFEDNNCTTNNGGGAIGAYNYGTGYNITICSSRFNYNTNLCYAYTNISTTSVGRGGAISVLNGGYLTVCNSNFTGNYAKIGQAIAAATYTYANGSGGNPHIKICNNRFVNHTADGIDTVVITGNDYVFYNNTFINSYQNTQYNESENTDNLNNLKTYSDTVLCAINSEILADNEVILYVNGSLNSGSNDGSSWENAIHAQYGIDTFIYDKLFSVNDKVIRKNNATVYVADYEYSDFTLNYEISEPITITFIGQGPNTIFNVKSSIFGTGANPNYQLTFINLTIKGSDFGVNSNFINCVFPNLFTISKDLGTRDSRPVDEDGTGQTYFMNFKNCTFKDVTTTDALITLYQYGAANFSDCIFDNITADSIVYRTATYYQDDAITFKECTFTNSKFNGVADSSTNFDDAIVIEDCNYDSEVALGTTEVDGHFYVNATKLKAVAVDTSVLVNSSAKGSVVITLNDIEGNPIKGAEFNYTINDNDAVTAVTDENGTFTISDLIGEITIAVNYEGNASYNANSTSKYFDFKLNSSISITNESKVITIKLVDENNNVIKDATITYTINDGESVDVTLSDGQYTISDISDDEFEIKVQYAGNSTYNAAEDASEKFNFTAASQNSTNTTDNSTSGNSTSGNTTDNSTSTNTTDNSTSGGSSSTTTTKVASKITAKKKTFKAKKKTKKYKITLKAGSKAIKKVKVTLKVGKKTYKATTNAKGKATFKITKLTKKGKYTAVIKFKGNSAYKASSKKVKITVKK